MRKTLYIILLMLLPSVLMAQKKEIADARVNIKKGVNLDKAEASMRKLLTDSANLQNEKIWLTLFDAVKKQYEQLNEKLYLKQQSDTAKLLTHTFHMFDVLESMDSVDVKNTKGKPEYRKKHAAFLNQYRQNLFGGGAYYLKKQNYKEASSFFGKYVACKDLPLYVDYNYAVKDSTGIAEAAYWMTFCGYKIQKTDMVDDYAELALRSPSREVYVMQYQAESAFLKNDIDAYAEVLKSGFEKYPSNAYFFPHLISYYAQRGKHEEILAVSRRVLSIDKDNVEALQASSSALYSLGRYDACIKASDRLIELDDSRVQAYLNAGLSYYHKTDDLFRVAIPNQKQRKQLNDLCAKALPYLEHYREACPEDTDSYAQPLYNIYLTLNMGEGFEEMEHILYGE